MPPNFQLLAGQSPCQATSSIVGLLPSDVEKSQELFVTCDHVSHDSVVIRLAVCVYGFIEKRCIRWNMVGGGCTLTIFGVSERSQGGLQVVGAAHFTFPGIDGLIGFAEDELTSLYHDNAPMSYIYIDLQCVNVECPAFLQDIK